MRIIRRTRPRGDGCATERRGRRALVQRQHRRGPTHWWQATRGPRVSRGSWREGVPRGPTPGTPFKLSAVPGHSSSCGGASTAESTSRMAAARFTITSWERPVFAIASTGHRYVQICAAVDAGRNGRGRHNRFIRYISQGPPVNISSAILGSPYKTNRGPPKFSTN